MPQLEDEEERPAGASSGAATDGAQQQENGTHRSRWLLKVSLEVVLISVGVFLALMGEQWQESTHT